MNRGICNSLDKKIEILSAREVQFKVFSLIQVMFLVLLFAVVISACSEQARTTCLRNARASTTCYSCAFENVCTEWDREACSRPVGNVDCYKCLHTGQIKHSTTENNCVDIKYANTTHTHCCPFEQIAKCTRTSKKDLACECTSIGKPYSCAGIECPSGDGSICCPVGSMAACRCINGYSVCGCD